MTTNDDTPRSPFASDYAVNQPPRLSIVHFLGITACVASYLGTLQTVRSLDPGFERYLPIMRPVVVCHCECGLGSLDVHGSVMKDHSCGCLRGSREIEAPVRVGVAGCVKDSAVPEPLSFGETDSCRLLKKAHGGANHRSSPRAYPKTRTEKGTGTFCSEDSAK